MLCNYWKAQILKLWFYGFVGGLLTSYDVRTYRAMKFMLNCVDVIMVLEVSFLCLSFFISVKPRIIWHANFDTDIMLNCCAFVVYQGWRVKYHDSKDLWRAEIWVMYIDIILIWFNHKAIILKLLSISRLCLASLSFTSSFTWPTRWLWMVLGSSSHSGVSMKWS